jgi:hypothetical protein
VNAPSFFFEDANTARPERPTCLAQLRPRLRNHFERIPGGLLKSFEIIDPRRQAIHYLERIRHVTQQDGGIASSDT